MRAIIEYQVATYSGKETVFFNDPNEENETLIAKAKNQLRQKCGGELPFGYQSFKVIERED